MAILPSPLGSQAKPIRGAGLKRCPFKQPAFEFAPMATVGNRDPGTSGKVPPFPPHCSKPFRGLPVPERVVRVPSAALKPGAVAAVQAVGSKCKAGCERSREVPHKVESE